MIWKDREKSDNVIDLRSYETEHPNWIKVPVGDYHWIDSPALVITENLPYYYKQRVNGQVIYSDEEFQKLVREWKANNFRRKYPFLFSRNVRIKAVIVLLMIVAIFIYFRYYR